MIINRIPNFRVKKEKDLLVGYDMEKKRYKIYYTESNKLVISRKCAFREKIFEVKEKFTRICRISHFIKG